MTELQKISLRLTMSRARYASARRFLGGVNKQGKLAHPLTKKLAMTRLNVRRAEFIHAIHDTERALGRRA